MPDSFQQRLASVTAKAAMVTQRYHLAVEQRDQALAEVEKLTKQLEESKKAVEQLATQVEYLKIASIIEFSAGDTQKAREFISELVWEIDKCISQLND